MHCGNPAGVCRCSVKYDEGTDALFFVSPYDPKKDTVSKRLVLSLKSKRLMQTLDFMSNEMQNADGLSEAISIFKNSGEPLIVTYVPRDPSTIIKCGFDQSEELAKRFAKGLNLPFASLISHKQGGQSQKELGSQNRSENAKKVYCPGKESKKVANSHIILIDDVVTTGATTSACASVLKALGAKSVIIIAFAKNETLKYGYSL